VTSEEVTAQRRAERQQFKRDRARALAEAAAAAEAVFDASGTVISAEEQKVNVPSAATWRPQKPLLAPSLGEGISGPAPTDGNEDDDDDDIQEIEHLQLTLPEAFFLAWALDCLTILHPDTVIPAAPPLALQSN
jgi:tRNA-splicing endonuclease subunit Sen2